MHGIVATLTSITLEVARAYRFPLTVWGRAHDASARLVVDMPAGRRGVLVVQCNRNLARSLCAVVFDQPFASLTIDDERRVLAEIARALVAGLDPDEVDVSTKSSRTVEVCFESSGRALIVQLLPADVRSFESERT